jgi:hypothetical protein
VAVVEVLVLLVKLLQATREVMAVTEQLHQYQELQ